MFFVLVPVLFCNKNLCYLKRVIVYLAQDIPAFVMYCVYGESRSSLLIESTGSMMNNYFKVNINKIFIVDNYKIFLYRDLEEVIELEGSLPLYTPRLRRHVFSWG